MLLIPCPDCGARYPDLDGPVHRYVGGSPGCWVAFGELGAREMDLALGGPNRLSVHAYMVQHHGVEGRPKAQSVGVHLMVLCAVLAHGWKVSDAVTAMQRWLRTDPVLPWLAPPDQAGRLTIQSVPADADRATHERAVRAWAMDVWNGWAAHHATVERWFAADRPG